MKVLLLLSTLVAVSLCELEDTRNSFIFTNENGETWLEDLTQKPNITSTIDDVTLYYYSQNSRSNPYTFKCNDVSEVKNTAFNASKPTVFVIHGWQNSGSSEMCITVKDALLSAHDVNVFVVDWNPVAKESYITAVTEVVKLGEYVAGFIYLLESRYGLNLSNVKVVGHSLGAHIAGNVGSALNGKVGVVIGLDPAGPLFPQEDTENRLDKSDGKFVQTIHTNAGGLGVSYSIGHSNYWPNGGLLQPGCDTDQYSICSHGRVFMYYAESINSNKFVAKKCANYALYTAGSCKSNPSSSMGMFNEDTKAEGDYLLDTNKESPFARG